MNLSSIFLVPFFYLFLFIYDFFSSIEYTVKEKFIWKKKCCDEYKCVCYYFISLFLLFLFFPNVQYPNQCKYN